MMKVAACVICTAIILCIVLEVSLFLYDVAISYIERNRK